MIEALKTVLSGQSLARAQAAAVMEKIIAGQAHPEQIGALLIALQAKQESVDEIVGFVEVLRRHARRVPVPRADLIDTCGTGGDGSGTFNISTTVTFVVAASGQAIAKHGNRSVSSRSGSFDVLEALGVPHYADAENVARSIDRHGLGFLFAPSFHPVLKNLAALRKNLGVRTVFNLLGPLLNPVGVRRQLIGVYNAAIVEKVAYALKQLGAEEAMVVRGEDGLDEITLTGPTRVAHLKNSGIRFFTFRPEEYGFSLCQPHDLLGGDAAENARILMRILGGEKGPKRDIAIVNAAAALVVGGKAADFKDGIEQARAAIDSGAALGLLKNMQKDAS